MARIVIVGAGIGGVTMAFEMKNIVQSSHEVAVISDASTFNFVPSNPWIPPRWRRPEDIKVELAPVMEKKDIAFIHKAASKIDPDNNQVVLGDGSCLSYDYLILATGPKLAFHEIQGLGPEGFTSAICHVDLAYQAAMEWRKLMDDPGPVIVGAVQGASCFGPAYEYLMILETELRKRKIRDRVPMTFVTSEPYLGHLGLGGVGDSKGLLENMLRVNSIKAFTNARVDLIEEGLMHITEINGNGQETGEVRLPFKHSMLVPAFCGVDALQGNEKKGLTDDRGFVIVDQYQRNPVYKNIYAVGVCVSMPPAEETPVPTGIPKTGYMIESMVAATACNIQSQLSGRDPSEVPSLSGLCLADLGYTGAALLAVPQVPPRNMTWTRTGKWVRHLKFAFEKYFLRKVRKGIGEPYYERLAMKFMGLVRLK